MAQFGTVAQKKLNNVRIQLRYDTIANWEASNVVLLAGEMAVASRTGTTPIIRVGDGVHTWSELPNGGSDIVEADTYTAQNGGKDRTHGAIKVNGENIQTFELQVADASIIGAVLSQTVVSSGERKGYANINETYVPGYVTVAADGKMTVTVVEKAEKLQTARTITFEDNDSGAETVATDVTGSFTFDGSANVPDVNLTLVDKFSDDTSKEYFSVMVDSKGRVLSAKEDTEVIATDGASGTLGLVKSQYDDAKAATADDNKGKVAIDANGNLTIDRVEESDKFHTARAISINENGTYAGNKNITAAGVNFDGSAAIDIAADLTDTGVVAGSYTRVTVDAKGRVNAASNNLVTADITDSIATTDKTAANAAKAIKTDATGELDDTFLKNITRTDTTDNSVTTAISSFTTDTKGRVTGSVSIQAVTDTAGAQDAGKLVKLNAAGKLSNTLFPALAIGEVQHVEYTDSESVGAAGVTAFKGITTAQSGDMVVVHTTQGASEDQAVYEARRVTNGDGVYVYAANTSGDEAYSAANWVLVSIPGSAIQSVNGYQGPTIVLDTDDVAEDAAVVTDVVAGNTADVTAGHNRYYTQARVSAYLATLDARADAVFVNSDKIVYDTDEIIFNAGGASGNTFVEP